MVCKHVCIGDGVNIGEDVVVDSYAQIGSYAQISNSVKIQKNAFIESCCCVEDNINRYRYKYDANASGYDSGGDFIIRLGCSKYSRDWWEDNFWNNIHEFPDDPKNPDSILRLAVFNHICMEEDKRNGVKFVQKVFIGKQTKESEK
jgi:hypothetical protein